jgi:hypothetical protein
MEKTSAPQQSGRTFINQFLDITSTIVFQLRWRWELRSIKFRDPGMPRIAAAIIGNDTAPNKVDRLENEIYHQTLEHE